MASIGQNMCKSSARKLGYHEFEIDTGITGIFLEDNYFNGRGVKVRSVWNNSPAKCAGISSGQYLYQVENREVKNSEDAYNLLDNRSKKK
jgi:S1-C subfamily serine protease